MPLTTLKASCAISKKSYSEMGRGVRCQEKPGEKIRFFLIDPPNNPACRLKEKFQLKRICDLIVTLEQKAANYKCMAFIELKGNVSLSDALDQILLTSEPFFRAGLFSDKAGERFVPQAILVTKNASPTKTKKGKSQKHRISGRFQKNIIIRSLARGTLDVGIYLRREKGKRT